MENTLLGLGVVCILAAIVGGGLKAFAVEVPIIASKARQLILGVVGLVLIGTSVMGVLPNHAGSLEGNAHAEVSPPPPDLSVGTWTLRDAIDVDHVDWSNSTLKFTFQEKNSTGLSLRGRFTWRRAGSFIGYEDFTGQYLTQRRQVLLEGFSVTDRQLAVGSYSAILSEDERELKDGRWGSTSANDDPGSPGRWEAAR